MRLIPSALLPIALAVPLLAGPALSKEFKDWEIGCDNTGTCQAVGMSVDDTDSSGYLTISRSGGAQSKPEFVIWAVDNGDDPQIAKKTYALAIDDKPVSGLERTFSFTAYADADGFLEAKLNEAEGNSLIAGFKNGQKLTLKAPDGTVAVNVSLNGSMASLLYMDDKQHRLGTVTALARPGDKAASTVPNPPAPPVVTVVKPPVDAKAEVSYLGTLRKKLLKDKSQDCVADDPDANPDLLGGSDPLDNTHTLVTINCSNGGAYNIQSEFFLVTKGDIVHARMLKFDELNEDAGSLKPAADDSLTNGSFDPASGQINYFAKSRGIGDCGAMGSYGWDGTKFQIISEQSFGQCKGVNSDQWPTYWRSTVAEKK